jgi:hypothetical protein
VIKLYVLYAIIGQKNLLKGSDDKKVFSAARGENMIDAFEQATGSNGLLYGLDRLTCQNIVQASKSPLLTKILDAKQEELSACLANEQCKGELFSGLDDELCRQIAKKSLSPEMLDLLADHPFYLVRFDVCENEKVSQATLQRLAHDGEWYVRSGAAEFVTDSVLIKALAEDEDATVRGAVAHNLAAPVETLKQLTQDRENWVSQAAETRLLCPRMNAASPGLSLYR